MSERFVRHLEPDEIPPTALLPEGLDPLAEGILMRHQAAWVEDTADLKLAEKGRRTGITFAEALDDTLTAATRRAEGGDNVIYIGDSKDKAIEFVAVAAHFARVLSSGLISGGVEECLFTEVDAAGNSRDITSYRIRFASGNRILGLSSRPAAIRGGQGIVVVDEAAFHPDVKEVLKAVAALLIWGGKVRVISTHNGVLNPFNELVREIRAGKVPYSLHHIPFDTAVENGLYERVCLIRGWTPSAEGKRDWYQRVRGVYGTDVAAMQEELDVVPKDGEGAWLTRALIEARMVDGVPFLRWACPADLTYADEGVRQRTADDWCREQLAPVLELLDGRAKYFVGGDIARVRDVTVFWVLAVGADLVRRTAFVVELRTCPFDLQLRIFSAIADGVPRFMAGGIDRTGQGAPLAEAAAQKYGATRIEEATLSIEWYRLNMEPVRSALGDGTLTLPRHDDVLTDLRMVQVSGGVAKVPSDLRIEGSDGEPRHGDSAVALVIAYTASRQDPPEHLYIPALPREPDRMRMGPAGDDDRHGFEAPSRGRFGAGAW